MNLKDNEKRPIVEFLLAMRNKAEAVEDYELCAEVMVTLERLDSEDSVLIAYNVCKNFGEVIAANVNKKGQMFLTYSLIEDERYVFEILDPVEFDYEKNKIKR